MLANGRSWRRIFLVRPPPLSGTRADSRPEPALPRTHPRKGSGLGAARAPGGAAQWPGRAVIGHRGGRCGPGREGGRGARPLSHPVSSARVPGGAGTAPSAGGAERGPEPKPRSRAVGPEALSEFSVQPRETDKEASLFCVCCVCVLFCLFRASSYSYRLPPFWTCTYVYPMHFW